MLITAKKKPERIGIPIRGFQKKKPGLPVRASGIPGGKKLPTTHG